MQIMRYFFDAAVELDDGAKGLKRRIATDGPRRECRSGHSAPFMRFDSKAGVPFAHDLPSGGIKTFQAALPRPP
jgi:hypothetical protein